MRRQLVPSIRRSCDICDGFRPSFGIAIHPTSEPTLPPVRGGVAGQRAGNNMAPAHPRRQRAAEGVVGPRVHGLPRWGRSGALIYLPTQRVSLLVHGTQDGGRVRHCTRPRAVLRLFPQAIATVRPAGLLMSTLPSARRAWYGIKGPSTSVRTRGTPSGQDCSDAISDTRFRAMEDDRMSILNSLDNCPGDRFLHTFLAQVVDGQRHPEAPCRDRSAHFTGVTVSYCASSLASNLNLL